MDTIYAPATGQGGAAIAVIRISGPMVATIVQSIAGDLPKPRMAALRDIRAAGGEVLDEALVLWFPEGASYTGEEMAEIQCHGGRAVLRALMSRIGEFENTRLAEPGEFTRRAVMAGRMGLIEAEGLGDLVAAETEAQRRQALQQKSGSAAIRIEAWRAKLLRARALVEATIDWADEEVPEDVSPEVSTLVGEVVSDLRAALDHVARGSELRDGYEVALIGPPNVGKSSLLNALAGRDAAIVSSTPGTTRDVIELRYDLDGLPVVFLDTAGLRDTGDGIEAEGIRLAEARAAGAALRLHLVCHDAERFASDKLHREGDIVVGTKSDLGSVPSDVSVSVVSGSGLPALLDLVKDCLSGRIPVDAVLVNERQQAGAEECLQLCLVADLGAESELLADDLRRAIRALDRLTGRRDVEDILGVVFGEFCLGK